MKNSIISLEPYLSYPIPNQSKTLSLFQKQINTAIENSEHEEHFKNLFNNFLKTIYSYDINTHKRIDCIIKESGQLEALIEVKHPQNLKEITIDSNFNNKAFHELLLYYYEQIQTLITKDITDEQLDTLQNETDNFVYALYGLSTEEIAIVEGGDR